MTKSDAERAAVIAAGVVIVVLTAAAFWLSYAHLADVARHNGLAASPERRWAWPATLDLFIVAGEVLMFLAALRARTDWWAIGLTVTGSLGSIGLNVAGVGPHQPLLHYVVAAVPPFAALLAFGALMRQVHRLIPDTAQHLAAVAAAEPVSVERADQPPAPAAPPRTPELPAASPVPAVSVPAALIAHARKVADAHHAATGQLIDSATLRARLGVPAPLADAIAAQLT
ncbi:DUF2637 domain-containing protein [Actinacidiphila acidipaludis]|uniref:DUF2637 domain-containing protein n=1 Tax=Actinacidiphila acidipaludis TaxID=2873382 RepID=A0ABS7QG57_9ACTN|nr:DUF2637 domain-containing protein [Streptomyces acidipaludis]MBY8880754.1 DUF2637 domain-containing protein [Streptomyces acidipaludis]